MNKSIKTLVCSAVASIVLLACNDATGFNPNSGDDDKTIRKNSQAYNPPVLLIDDDVRKWMEEQLASEGSEKRLVMISDMYMPEDTESAAGLSATIDSDGKVEYFLNGNKIGSEEYTKKWVEYDKQRTDKGKRDLSIPGEVISSGTFSWDVLMTAKELSALLKNYDKLAINFPLKPTPDV